MTIAVLGAGRMGSVAAEQLPEDVKKIIIDQDAETAERIADRIGGSASQDYTALSDADMVLLLLPASVIPEAAEKAVKYLKPGTIVLNMATKGEIPEKLKSDFPGIRFVDAKIIGHADSMREGAPCMVIAGTEDDELLGKIRHVLPGYASVISGDPSLVPVLSSIASEEGIRAAVRVKQQAMKHHIPEEWLRPLIYTVAAGTMRAYIDGNMGEFARKIAEKFEAEES